MGPFTKPRSAWTPGLYGAGTKLVAWSMFCSSLTVIIIQRRGSITVHVMALCAIVRLEIHFFVCKHTVGTEFLRSTQSVVGACAD